MSLRNSIFLFLFFSPNTNALSDDEKDIFSEYNADIKKPAHTETKNIYNAVSENIINMVRIGLRDGIIVNGACSYANGKVQADGMGNINVAKGANVGTLVNKTTIKNSNIIFSNKHK